MKTYVLAPFAVIALWLGLSAVWMGQTASTSTAVAATADGPAASAAPVVAAAPSGPVMTDPSLRAPLGPVMTELLPSPAAGTASVSPAVLAPVAWVPEAVTAPASGEETLARVQALEARLTAALDALERRGGDGSPGVSTPQAPSFLLQLVTIVGSAPVIGFLVMLLLALVVAAWGRPSIGSPVIARLMAILHRLTAPASGAADQLPPGTEAPEPGSGGTRRIYGQTMTHIQANGQPLQAGVFDENQVRAAAGLTLVLGAVAFAYAYLAKVYLPIQVVTTLFFVEFLIRITWGITRSPLGLVAGWMARRAAPIWVSAKPKRFAWSLGLVLSLTMTIITNSGIRGPLPLTICLICLTLMWLEAVLGLCLGCEIYRHLVRLGWMKPDKDFEICTNGACTVQSQPLFQR